MRVVKYVAGWPPERFPNGIVTATSVLAPAMRARGCDLRILAATGVSTDDRVSLLGDTAKVVDRLLIHRIQGRVRPQSAVFTLGAEQIARAISQTPGLRTADLLEIEESFGWTALLRKRLTMPIVVGLHGPWFLNGAALNDGIFDVQGRERVSREGCAIASAEAICARSRYVLNAVREYYALELREAATIPNPAQPAEQQSLWRRDKADPNEILFVGR
ncbi:MAG TPA: glycosyltransferase, partial [Parvularculaceae bacterium]|nr:glycosyltransferase [Parvularculaceae bacterium]